MKEKYNKAILILLMMLATMVGKSQSCINELSSGIMGDYYYYWDEITCSNTPLNIQLTPCEWEDLDINNGANTDIAIKIVINHMPDNAMFSVHINNTVETRDWQTGQTYIFKTFDNSGYCWIEAIGEPADEVTTGLLDFTVSYVELTNGEISNFNDRLKFVQTALVTQQNKYVGKPMSYLIQDFNNYQLPIIEFIPHNSNSTIGEYNSIKFYFDYYEDVRRYQQTNSRYIIIRVEFNDFYPYSVIKSVYQSHDAAGNESGWDTDFENVLSGNIVSSIEVSEVTIY